MLSDRNEITLEHPSMDEARTFEYVYLDSPKNASKDEFCKDMYTILLEQDRQEKGQFVFLGATIKLCMTCGVARRGGEHETKFCMQTSGGHI